MWFPGEVGVVWVWLPKEMGVAWEMAGGGETRRRWPVVNVIFWSDCRRGGIRGGCGFQVRWVWCGCGFQKRWVWHGRWLVAGRLGGGAPDKMVEMWTQLPWQRLGESCRFRWEDGLGCSCGCVLV